MSDLHTYTEVIRRVGAHDTKILQLDVVTAASSSQAQVKTSRRTLNREFLRDFLPIDDFMTQANKVLGEYFGEGLEDKLIDALYAEVMERFPPLSDPPPESTS